jgi:HlyD family secretion protein
MRYVQTPVCICSAILLAIAGCRQASDEAPPAAKEQATRRVAVVNPERKTIHREVGQPGLIQAFERTPIVARIPGYVLKWNVDIGDPIHQGEVLAELWVPEMVSELRLREQQVQLAQKTLAMAEARVATAKARVQEAEASQGRAEANHNYWKSQSARFTKLVSDSVLDKQTQEETLNQFRAASAGRAEAAAKVESARALQREQESARDKAEVDIRVADADRQRQADLVGYARLTAPFDGVVTQRNVNTRQLVQPGAGTQADVLYVVERIDTVRVMVSVPENDAAWVRIGAPATVRIQALTGKAFKGTVTRTAASLNRTTRTLPVEIDLPNPEQPQVGRQLKSGMYAYATIEATSPEVLTLPASAVLTEGDVNVGFKTFCFVVENGRAKRTQIEIGARNDQLVEVLNKRVTTDGTARWEPFTGTEQVVRGELSGLQDGQAVEVSS